MFYTVISTSGDWMTFYWTRSLRLSDDLKLETSSVYEYYQGYKDIISYAQIFILNDPTTINDNNKALDGEIWDDVKQYIPDNVSIIPIPSLHRFIQHANDDIRYKLHYLAWTRTRTIGPGSTIKA
ncbi:hypothetical protein GUITHDRAFT_120185 [Guillardia theta CCMP2712]|uniref:Uncharacterized protein n=1 Tax=Guillardia theta (strain CCMP2712) TaxID=905079 RepID=L1IBP4_GUITC|nr:hypothetical protein GUITHDRAFT_120185 [Guillardia theta CCMP2712]EKX33658.1 hypothetical protein GUITHDRAFT_120185 [Guillardia theta CCMP2712]|eukprot:XP_005820638.1 hypothetical protein GUITHDRAFT_120185 [Guillardia theta CCMP2712]